MGGDREYRGQGPDPEVSRGRLAPGADERARGQQREQAEQRVGAPFLAVVDEEGVERDERGRDHGNPSETEPPRDERSDGNHRGSEERRQGPQADLADPEDARPSPGHDVVERRRALAVGNRVERLAQRPVQDMSGRDGLVVVEGLHIERCETQRSAGERDQQYQLQVRITAKTLHPASYSCCRWRGGRWHDGVLAPARDSRPQGAHEDMQSGAFGMTDDTRSRQGLGSLLPRGWRPVGRPAHHRRDRDLRQRRGGSRASLAGHSGRLGAAGARGLALHADPVRRLLQPRAHPHQCRRGRRPRDRLGRSPAARPGPPGWSEPELLRLDRPATRLVDHRDADRELRLPRLSALRIPARLPRARRGSRLRRRRLLARPAPARLRHRCGLRHQGGRGIRRPGGRVLHPEPAALRGDRRAAGPQLVCS